MPPNQSDITAMQQCVQMRQATPDGLRFYTADYDSVSLANFYRGRSAFLVLSGPSLNQVDLTQLTRRGIVTMGVNNSWSVYRPTLWTGVDDPGRFIDVGWKDPGITKFVPLGHWSRRLRVQASDGVMGNSVFRVAQMPSVYFYPRANDFDHNRFLNGDAVQWGCDPDQADSLGIRGKRSVMLVALRLLHHLGFRTVYLLGCDFRMADDRKYAFDETRDVTAIRQNNALYSALSRRFEALLPHFEQHRFRVVNCSPGSELGVFERMRYDAAVAAASAECSKPISTQGWYTPIPQPSRDVPAEAGFRHGRY